MELVKYAFIFWFSRPKRQQKEKKKVIQQVDSVNAEFKLWMAVLLIRSGLD